MGYQATAVYFRRGHQWFVCTPPSAFVLSRKDIRYGLLAPSWIHSRYVSGFSVQGIFPQLLQLALAWAMSRFLASTSVTAGTLSHDAWDEFYQGSLAKHRNTCWRVSKDLVIPCFPGRRLRMTVLFRTRWFAQKQTLLWDRHDFWTDQYLSYVVTARFKRCLDRIFCLLTLPELAWLFSVKSAYTYQLLKLIYMGLFLHYIVRNQIKRSFFLHLVRFLLVPLG